MSFLDKIYQKNPVVVTRKIGEEIILVPSQQQAEDSENVFTLNDMAAGIWVQIDGNTCVRTIKERILNTFKVSSEQVEKDLIDFLLQLEQSDMISCQTLKEVI